MSCFVMFYFASSSLGRPLLHVPGPSKTTENCTNCRHAATNNLYILKQMLCVYVQGLGLCHGISGNAYSFLSLYRATKDDLYKRRAQHFAQIMAEHWKEMKDIPDAPLSLYEVSHIINLLQHVKGLHCNLSFTLTWWLHDVEVGLCQGSYKRLILGSLIFDPQYPCHKGSAASALPAYVCQRI